MKSPSDALLDVLSIHQPLEIQISDITTQITFAIDITFLYGQSAEIVQRPLRLPPSFGVYPSMKMSKNN